MSDDDGTISLEIYNGQNGWVIAVRQYGNVVMIPMRSENHARTCFAKIRQALETHGEVD